MICYAIISQSQSPGRRAQVGPPGAPSAGRPSVRIRGCREIGGARCIWCGGVGGCRCWCVAPAVVGHGRTQRPVGSAKTNWVAGIPCGRGTQALWGSERGAHRAAHPMVVGWSRRRMRVTACHTGYRRHGVMARCGGLGEAGEGRWGRPRQVHPSGRTAAGGRVPGVPGTHRLRGRQGGV